MGEFDVREWLRQQQAGGGATAAKPKRALQDYSETELRQLWRAERIDEAAWHAELVARGSSAQAATDSIARQKNVGLSTAASTRGQPTASEAAAVNAFKSTAPPPVAPINPTAPQSLTPAPFGQPGDLMSQLRDPLGTRPPSPAVTDAAGGGSAVGPAGRTVEQIRGTDYLSQAERDWYLQQTGARPSAPAATSRPTGGTTTNGGAAAPRTTGGTTTARTGAISPNSKPGEQELIDAGGLHAGPGIYWVPTTGGGWALYREGTKGDYSFSRALNKTELAVAQREAARRQQADPNAPVPEGITPPAQGGDRFFNPETNTVGPSATSSEGRYIPSFVGNESAEEYGRTGRGLTDPVFGTGKFNAAGDETMTSRPVINGVQIDPAMLANRGYVAATLGFDPGGMTREQAEERYRGLGLMAPARAPTPPGPVLPPEDNSKPTRGEQLAMQPQTPTPEQTKALEMGTYIPPEEFGYPQPMQEGGQVYSASVKAEPYFGERFEDGSFGIGGMPPPDVSRNWWDRQTVLSNAFARPFNRITPPGPGLNLEGLPTLFHPNTPEYIVPEGSPLTQFAEGGSVSTDLMDPNQYKQPQNPTTMSPMQTVFPGDNPLPAGAIGQDFEGNPLYEASRVDWNGQRGGGRGGMGYVNPPTTYAERFRQAYGSPWGSMGPQKRVTEYQLMNDMFMNNWIQQERERLIRQGQFAAADRLRPQNSAFPDRVWPSGGVRAFNQGGQVLMNPQQYPSMAGGGQVMLNEPAAVVGQSGQTYATLGEPNALNGGMPTREVLDVQPLEASVPMPMSAPAPRPMTPMAMVLEQLMTPARSKSRPKPMAPVGSTAGGGY